MAHIRQIRSRIRSIRNIQQITRAMKMVASARLHKAQRQLLQARPYAYKMREMIQDIGRHAQNLAHPLVQGQRGSVRAVVTLTSDKGMCGGFNGPPLVAALKAAGAAPPAPPAEILILGRKGVVFFRRSGIKAVREWSGFWQEVSWTHADSIGQELIDGFTAGRWSRVDLVYNRFKSVLIQELVQTRLLPLDLGDAEEGSAGPRREHLFEPAAEAIYAYLLPRYVKNIVWHAFLESKAAEMAARMQSMDNATQSAGDMIGEMTLQLNRARQATITREISELVGGAEAIGW